MVYTVTITYLPSQLNPCFVNLKSWVNSMATATAFCLVYWAIHILLTRGKKRRNGTNIEPHNGGEEWTNLSIISWRITWNGVRKDADQISISELMPFISQRIFLPFSSYSGLNNINLYLLWSYFFFFLIFFVIAMKIEINTVTPAIEAGTMYNCLFCEKI